MRRCVYRKQLDLETLVCTRGPNFPLGRLEGRLMCPACGNRRVTWSLNRRAMLREWEVGDKRLRFCYSYLSSALDGYSC